jgi:hypothetical protein
MGAVAQGPMPGLHSTHLKAASPKAARPCLTWMACEPSTAEAQGRRVSAAGLPQLDPRLQGQG